jgi:ATP dependent DNA ligase domain
MLWRTTLARSRRLLPAGFIQPAPPLLTTKSRLGPEWIHEIKFDGYRLLALKDARRVVLWSRYATDYSETFVRIAEAVRALPIDTALLGGEAVGLSTEWALGLCGAANEQGRGSGVIRGLRSFAVSRRGLAQHAAGGPPRSARVARRWDR